MVPPHVSRAAASIARTNHLSVEVVQSIDKCNSIHDLVELFKKYDFTPKWTREQLLSFGASMDEAVVYGS